MKNKNYQPPEIGVLKVFLESSINAASINTGSISSSNIPYVDDFLDDNSTINTGTDGFDI